MVELKEGYMIDYISGVQVKETPEETEAVQPFARILVDDYGYPKENIHTRPPVQSKGTAIGYQEGIPGGHRCFYRQ